LIDLNMPDIDGLEVCRRIRARKQMESVRLITMTSNHSPEVVEQSKQAGAIACLAKPLDVQQVLELFRIPLALGTKK
ncbi:MAG TPA: response regulator, partial [Hyalangium sp.]|nr:response regulator [Hyalangium sp.]